MASRIRARRGGDDAVRGRWTPLVLREFLIEGTLSYSDLSAALPGLSDKVLSDRLTHLTRIGVLERHRTRGWTPRSTYTLTERGAALQPVLRALWEWGRSGPSTSAG